MRDEVTVSEPATNLHDRATTGNVWTPDRVAELRMKTKLNQTAFGKLAGVTRQTVGEWERGESDPSKLNQQALRDIAAALESPLAGSARVGVTASGTLTTAPAVREERAYYTAHTAELRGRSMEVEALLAYALERQRLLTQSLGEAATLTPNATPEELEAATARQMKADAEAGLAKAREA